MSLIPCQKKIEVEIQSGLLDGFNLILTTSMEHTWLRLFHTRHLEDIKTAREIYVGPPTS